MAGLEAASVYATSLPTTPRTVWSVYSSSNGAHYRPFSKNASSMKNRPFLPVN